MAKAKARARGRTAPRRAPKPEAKPDLKPLRFPGTFAFVGSGCLLVLEIVAGRILAPAIGTSLYTWTSVIGVVLAGLSVGNYVGGKLADRWPGRTTLSYQYLASAVACGLILLLSRDIPSIAPPADWPAQLQVLWLSTILFFLPSVLLGTITPMIVKLALSSLDETGRVVGRIQAAATLGSILGVFLTGFILISIFGTRTIVGEVAIALVALAIACNPPRADLAPEQDRAATIVLSGAAVITLAVTALTITYDNPCFRESNYYCIRVYEDRTGEFKQLSLDALINGIVSVKHPTDLVYPYEQLYGQITDAKYKKKGPLTAFAIGGGTYTFPRYLGRYYDGKTMVAEIDPEVTDVVRSQLGLRDKAAGVTVINKDARPVLRDLSKNDRYDLILGDAFADIAIPYHLVSREFDKMVRDHLKPDGMYLSNVLDGVHYDFLRSYIKTLNQVFPYIRLLVSPSTAGQQNAFVVVASMKPPPQTPSMLPQDRFVRFMKERDPVTLTDDYAPVDQLLAPVFRQRLHRRPDAVQSGV